MAAPRDPRVQTALETIEEAQRLLSQAAEDLCSVEGFADEWRATLQVYETLKAHWYAVANREAALMGLPEVLP
jgi:hypothetical protein